MEGRQGMRPAPEQLRAHCQYFSRLGWALFGYMAAMLAVQTAAAAAAALLAPGLPAQPVFLWLLSVLSGYGAGGLVFFLVVRGVPAPPPAPEPPAHYRYQSRDVAPRPPAAPGTVSPPREEPSALLRVLRPSH